MNVNESRTLEPDILEQFQAQRITSARFAYFEHHDERLVEDISISYQDGKTLEEPTSDTLALETYALLEEATREDGYLQSGYFLVQVALGTITRLDAAFALELRWWQLNESVQRALEASGAV
jgi:hypothetical protein